jgi:hypothetical protein
MLYKEDIRMTKISLYGKFNAILKFNIVNFNYNFFLDINGVSLEEDLNVSDKSLFIESIFHSMLFKFTKGNLIYATLLFDLYNVKNMKYDINTFEFESFKLFD